MPIESKTNYTLFLLNLVMFGLFAFAFSTPFWQTNYFEEVAAGNIEEIVKGIVFLILFFFLPLWLLSLTIKRLTVIGGQLKVIDIFGVRRKFYTLQHVQNFTVKTKTSQYYFTFLPSKNNYKEYSMLSITTVDGHQLHIKSKYYKNFEEIRIAIVKAIKKK